MTTLLHTLQTLETALHHPGVRCSRERLEQLLHPDFHEVGRSGAAYSRETVIRYLSGVEAPPTVQSDAFAVAELGPATALLTYRSAAADPGTGAVLCTWRSSVWLHTPAGWQLRYHQGTPAAQPW